MYDYLGPICRHLSSFSHMKKRFLFPAVIAIALAGCGEQAANTDIAVNSNAGGSGEGTASTADALKAFNPGGGKNAGQPRPGAQPMQTENAQAQPANWGADKGTQASPPQFQRGKLISQRPQWGSGGGAAPQPKVDPWAQRYSAWRLEKAATIHNWASVSMYPNGIDAFLKTAWTQGNMHIRLAMLGPQRNLEEFGQAQQNVKVSFQDKGGGYLKTIIVPLTEFKLDHPAANAGTPTLVVEGTEPVPLELYEQFYQWVFEWE